MRFLWVFMLVLIIVGIGITDELVLYNTFNRLEKNAAAIHLELETNGVTEEAVKKVEELNRFWTRRQNSMSLFIHNEETKFLGDRIATLRAFVTKDLKDEARVEAKVLIHEINLLRRQYRFTITNIF